ncbi:GDYXXLXY domain-containing protein [Pontibacter sp. H259]|uniref:GDYXXLXY domain-containing protein n=1 Tax=Pontibacter sp. H259 TaxID=3133421 RepID=UPI0030C63680
MQTKLKWIVVLVNLVGVLALFNWSVIEKEETLENGKLVLLKLAPVDPRSLMQGDYMRLNYAISQTPELDKLPSRGYAVLTLDKGHVAKLIRYQKEKEPLQQGELLLKYNKGDWTLNLGAESYFFEEGQAKTFEEAKYGGLKVDQEGNSILVGLYDKNRQQLQPKRLKQKE